MKIDLKSNENRRKIENVRSMIKDQGDLRNFDEFLAKHDSFDFADPENQKAAGACCGGENCCQFDITINAK